MDKHPLQTICEDLARDLDLEVRSYSGRGMFGKQCLGIDLPRRGAGVFIAGVIRMVADLDPNDDASGFIVDVVADAMEHMETDAMGLGTIVYFPTIDFIE